jgi:hypothetical protein
VTAGTLYNLNNSGNLYPLAVPQSFATSQRSLFDNSTASNLYG